MKLRPSFANSTRFKVIPALMVLVLSSTVSHAANKYWDLNSTTSGLGAGAGSWDLSAANWNTATVGTAATVAFISGDDAFFQTAGVNTVTLGVNLTANSITQTTNTTATTITAGAGTQITLTTGNLTNSGNAALIISPDIVLGASGTINTSNSIALGGIVSDAGGGFGFSKIGTSTLTLNGANTYTGATNLGAAGSGTSAGTVTISGAAGSIATSSGYTINGSGSQLNLDYVGVAAGAVDRISNVSGVALTLNSGGELRMNGNTTAATSSTESIDTLTLGSGSGIITINNGGSGASTDTLTAAAFSRGSNATGLLRGSNLGLTANANSKIILTSQAGLTLVGNNTSAAGVDTGIVKNLTIVPYFLGGTSAGTAGSNFVTYDSTTGLRRLGSSEQSAISSGTIGDNVRTVAGSNAVTGSQTFNSLLLSSGGSGATPGTATSSVTGDGASTLTLTSGALANVATSATGNATVSGFTSIIFGTTGVNDAIITNANATAGGDLTISSPINTFATNGGLIKAGGGNVILAVNNLYTGVTTVNQGKLQIGNAGTTGDLGTSSSVSLNGGNLIFNRTNPFSYTNAITGTSATGGSTLTQAGTGTLTLGAIANVQTISRSVSTGALTTAAITGIGTLTDSSTTGSTTPTTINQTGTGLTIGTVNGASGSVVNLGGTGTTSFTNTLNTAGQTVSFNGGTINLNGSGSYGSMLVINGATVNTLSNSANTTNFRDVVNLQVLAGTFNVQSGSAIRLGSNAGTASASVAANAAGSQSGGTMNFTNNATLQLGNAATATATTDTFALSGGVFSALNTGSTGISIGAGASGGGISSFNFSGGTLRVGGTIAGAQGAGAQQSFVWTGGTMAVGTYNATNLTSTQGTAVSGSTNTLTNAGGILAPGDIGTGGKTIITGNYSVTSASASYAVDLGSATAATAFQSGAAFYDTTTVSGTVALGGTLNVSLINGFTPTNANTFTIITGTGGVSGNFTNVSGGKVTLTGGATFNVAVSGTTVVLSNYTASVGNTYATWISGFSVGGQTAAKDDFDNDGLSNVVENVLGSNPSVYNDGLTQVSATASSVTFRHNQSNTIATDVTKTYQWSTDLVEWKSSGQTNSGGTTATIAATTITDNVAPANDVIEVTITVTAGPATKVFGRLVATKAP